MSKSKRMLWLELAGACEADCKLKYRNFPDAAVNEANERISRIREEIDKEWLLSTRGVLGNDAVLKILSWPAE